MRFEVRYPSGKEEEVELQGSSAVVGRDASCDLVLDDQKCSRRHAEIEAGPEGMAIRDTGSANGVFVNGRKVTQASLEEGDVVQLGEVFLKVLSEEYPSTVVMGESPELEPSPPVAAARPSPPSRATPSMPPASVGERPSGPLPRPVTLSLLAALQVFSAVLLGAAGLLVAILWRAPEAPSALVLVGGAALWAVVGIAVGIGLWMRAGWARWAQVVLAALAVLSCAFLPFGVAVILYMFRKETRLQFSGRQDLRLFSAADARSLQEDSADTAFAGAVLGGLVLGLGLTAALGLLAGGAADLLGYGGGANVAAERLERLASAQEAFHTICDAGYADLEGLVHPSSAIDGYPEDTPGFLGEEFLQGEAEGYRFELRVEEALAGGVGCPTRSFKRYTYAATPLGGEGTHLVVGPDGRVRAAQDRSATLDDALYD